MLKEKDFNSIPFLWVDREMIHTFIRAKRPKVKVVGNAVNVYAMLTKSNIEKRKTAWFGSYFWNSVRL